VQGNAISTNIPFTIGMRDQVADHVAIKFSQGFYDAIGAGKGYESAFKWGKVAIGFDLANEESSNILVLRKKGEVDRQIEQPINKPPTIPNPQRSPQVTNLDGQVGYLWTTAITIGLVSSVGLTIWQITKTVNSPLIISSPSPTSNPSLEPPSVIPTATSSPSPKATVPSKTDEASTLLNKCQKVIIDNAKRLETIPNVQVTTNSNFRELSIPYPDPSAKLVRRYVFAMRGNGVYDVFKSRELTTEITQQIIDSCAGTAAVAFGRDQSSDMLTVGLFPDGSVKQFTCGADSDPKTRIRPPMAWGEMPCDM
jgi:hypothetical protein